MSSASLKGVAYDISREALPGRHDGDLENRSFPGSLSSSFCMLSWLPPSSPYLHLAKVTQYPPLLWNSRQGDAQTLEAGVPSAVWP